jgi:hypothetical protein
VAGLGDDGSAAVEMAPLALPVLEDGRVVRWTFPLELRCEVSELLFKVEAPIERDAERIRQPWKLLDTIESPKLSALEPKFTPSTSGALEMGLGLGLGLASGHLHLHLAIPSASGGGATGIRRHAAPEGPAGFVAPVSAGDPGGSEVAVESIWVPGQPLPAEVRQAHAEPVPPPPAAAIAGAGATKRCPSCYENVGEREAERKRECPNCGAPWVG